jgi:serine/threonine protein kinase
MLLEAAQGMLYLHSMSPALLLRDVKSANLLVDFHWTIKARRPRIGLGSG